MILGCIIIFKKIHKYKYTNVYIINIGELILTILRPALIAVSVETILNINRFLYLRSSYYHLKIVI